MRKLDVASVRAAGPETVKQVNRTIVLNLVRQLQPVSRTELAEVSSLNKSTITDIVKGLIAEKLLQETGFKNSNGGRRAVQLALNSPNIKGIVIDVGVQQTTLFAGDADGRYERLDAFLTPRDPRIFMERCFAGLDGILGGLDGLSGVHAGGGAFRGVTVSFPGLVDSVSGRVRLAPNLGWRNVELGALLDERYSLPVYVENEAKLCAVAEMWFGGPKKEGITDYGFVSVTEGIGVGLVIGNRLYRGTDGTGGEFGHMTVQLDGPQCGCGNRGCWETFASETAAARMYAEPEGPILAPNSSRNAGPGPSPGPSPSHLPDFGEVLAAGQAGEAKAARVLAEMGRYLGIGIANLVNGLNLKLVIVGGRVTQAWDVVGLALQAELAKHLLPSSATGLRIEPSTIERANVVGALVQAVSPVFSGVTLG